MKENDVQFVDAESFSGNYNDPLSFRMIVLEHLRRIGKIASSEFRGGYWTEKNVMVGGGTETIHTYVPDTREEYSNAVDYLNDILYPHFDKEILKELEEYQEWAEEKRDELAIKHTTENKEDGKRYFTKKEGYVFIDREAYKTEKVKVISRKHFRILNSFLKRNNYMDSARFEE